MGGGGVFIGVVGYSSRELNKTAIGSPSQERTIVLSGALSGILHNLNGEWAVVANGSRSNSGAGNAGGGAAIGSGEEKVFL